MGTKLGGLTQEFKKKSYAYFYLTERFPHGESC